MKKSAAILLALLMIFVGYPRTVNLAEAADAVLVTYQLPDTLGNASEILAGKTTEAQRSMLELARYDAIEITANGQAVEAYAAGVAVDHGWYDTEGYTLAQRYTPVAYFDFDGCVEIEIDVTGMETVCTDGAETLRTFTTASVSPVSRGASAAVNGKRISFTITQPGDYTVVLGGDEKTAIHIFANPLDAFEVGGEAVYAQPGATALPEGWEAASTIVFPPGEYFFGNNQILPESNQTVYLMGGAVVHSNIQINRGVSGVNIVGRGIIDDSESQSWMIDDGVPNRAPVNCCRGSSDIRISGITILNPSLWMIILNGADGVEINNVHLISGKHNGDGISVQSSRNVTVTDCFVRSWDDSLVVKNRSEAAENDISSHNILFRGVTVWTDLAQSMEIGYETNGGGLLAKPEIYDIAFEDITVIYNLHKPVISIHNADNAAVHDITYKNIVVENADMGKGDGAENAELIELSTKKLGAWASTADRGTITRVLIDGMSVLATDRAENTIRLEGYDENSVVRDITLKDIVLCGEELTTENRNDGRLKVETNLYTQKVRIISENDTIFTKLLRFILRIPDVFKSLMFYLQGLS